jgi:cytochrome c-type biogenesis protein CcmH/NrfG
MRQGHVSPAVEAFKLACELEPKNIATQQLFKEALSVNSTAHLTKSEISTVNSVLAL